MDTVQPYWWTAHVAEWTTSAGLLALALAILVLVVLPGIVPFLRGEPRRRRRWDILRHPGPSTWPGSGR